MGNAGKVDSDDLSSGEPLAELSAAESSTAENSAVPIRDEDQGMFSAVYDQLRDAAARWMSREGKGHSLQPTDLVHEVYVRMGEEGDRETDRDRFLAFASIAMRRILVDRARRVRALKRGAAAKRVPLSQVDIPGQEASVDLVALEDALSKLDSVQAGMSDVVVLRFLLGCSVAETSRVLSISPSKVKKDWAFAKAWLRVELELP